MQNQTLNIQFRAQISNQTASSHDRWQVTYSTKPLEFVLSEIYGVCWNNTKMLTEFLPDG